ncbi:MAG: DUF393 domain-containing protein [Desulfuromonadales bacterium]|nr:DUF393 domain-containing protein [Desulfuromonadales bacterium]
MTKSDLYPLQIFYDGSCVVCSAEMENYRRHYSDQQLLFIDISPPDFNAQDYGRSQAQLMQKLHLRDAKGQFYVGVDAFIVLWKSFPDGSLYRVFAALVDMPGLRCAADLSYALFARFRFLLPKRSVQCDTDVCHLNHPR